MAYLEAQKGINTNTIANTNSMFCKCTGQSRRLRKIQIQIQWQIQIQIPCFANALDRVGGSAMCACLSAPEARSALSPAPGISNTIESICVRIFSVFVFTFVLVFVY